MAHDQALAKVMQHLLKDDTQVYKQFVENDGTQFSDAIPKLQGLAKYAETHSDVYRRIEAVAKFGDALRVTDSKVRKAVEETKDAKALYEGPFAIKY